MSLHIRTQLLALVLMLAGCATPVPPSGGPADDIPPELVDASPEQGAINVDAASVTLTFSEYVDQSSFTQSFSISPAFERPVEFDWSRRSVTIRFHEPLRENTTYVLTIDSNLLDLHRVALTSPIVYAFSTGPTISAGALTGRVVAAAEGTPVAGVDVLAYAIPDSTAPGSLDQRPAYRTQTNAEGVFSFQYLTEQYYYVPALRDDNRSLSPDPQEPFAAPPAPAFFADTTAAAPAAPWVLARVDTTPPAPIRAQSAARSRHVVRFSEPVRFVERDPAAWTLADSSDGTSAAIEALYLLESEPREVHLITEPLQGRSYRIVPAALSDTSGNPLARSAVYFHPAADEDTLRIRFMGFLPDDPAPDEAVRLPRGVEPGVRVNRPLTGDLLRSAFSVSDSAGIERGFVAVTEDGTTYDLLPEPRLQPGERVTVYVDGASYGNPDTTYTRTFSRLSAEETGEIAGVVRMFDPRLVSEQRDATGGENALESFPDSADARDPKGQVDGPVVPDVADAPVVPEVADAATPPLIVEAYPVDVSVTVPTYTVTADSSGTFIFPGLPAGTYRVRAFADEDRNGSWSPGSIVPYLPPEGVAWHTEPVRVRSRWETALPDTLRIPILR